jgi:hypothetical protein
MNYQEIINSNKNKTNKAKALFELGYTRRQVADLVLGGNYGFAQNIYVKWVASTAQVMATGCSETSSPFAFLFNRTYGIEIEAFGIQRTVLGAALNAAGINCTVEQYNHTTRATWKLVTDSSINGQNGFELVSPVLSGAEGLAQLKKVCEVLKRLNAKINKSCGLHVHIGCGDLSLTQVKNLIFNYATLEQHIDAAMPESRRSNSYCKSISPIIETKKAAINRASETNVLVSTVCPQRYYKVNLQSLTRQQTIEFRQHSGSIEFDKISNWVLFCSRLVGISEIKRVNSFEEFCDTDLLTYLAARKQKFAGGR